MNESKFSNLNISSIYQRDVYILIALFIFGLLYTLPFLADFEFFRHTEADRTLIAWSMLRTHNAWIPSLFGDDYLTKPPLFYWLISLAISIAGSPFEWVARLPSALASSLLIPLSYLLVRKSGLDRILALLCSLILVWNFQFFAYSVVAEIDLVYAFFSFLTLSFLYLSIRHRRSWQNYLLTHVFLTLALLTKGPPILLFIAPAILFGPLTIQAREESSNVGTLRFYLRHFVCASIPLLTIVGLVYLLTSKGISLSELGRVWQHEVFDRFLKDPKALQRSRSALYYIQTIFSAFLPFSLIALVGLVGLKGKRMSFSKEPYLRFCLLVSLPAIFVFSLASGKSGRYLFPVYPFITPICAYALVVLWQEKYIAPLSRLLKSALVLTLALVCGFALFAYLKMKLLVILPLIVLTLLSFLLFMRLHQSPTLSNALLCLLLLPLIWRIPYHKIYAPIRNQKYGVKQLALDLNQQIPSHESLYVSEFFERWVTYYYLRLDPSRKILRLSPQIIKSQLKDKETIYLLINSDHEAWKVDKLNSSDYRQLTTYKTPKYKLTLYKVHSEALRDFPVQQIFPTDYSKPKQPPRKQ